MNEDKTLEWLGKGAQPTDTVKQILEEGRHLESFVCQGGVMYLYSIPVRRTFYMTEDTDMKQLVETIAKALVDDPTQVRATEEMEEDTTVIKLTVAKEDMGRIIGKEGRTAKAIRTLLNAVSTKDNKKAILKIVE